MERCSRFRLQKAVQLKRMRVSSLSLHVKVVNMGPTVVWHIWPRVCDYRVPGITKIAKRLLAVCLANVGI